MQAAVVLTHNRHRLLARCVGQLCRQVAFIVVVDNASTPPVTQEHTGHCVNMIIHDGHQPPNLAELMNEGLDAVAHHAAEWSRDTWDVAIICDDVEVPHDWFARVTQTMRAHGAVAASAHSIEPAQRVIMKTEPDRDIYNRMHGAAFVLAGERGIRADEDLHWWWQDTDLDWQARRAGGTVICPGPVAVNTLPNDFTHSRPELAERAGLDGQVFERKWGSRPW